MMKKILLLFMVFTCFGSAFALTQEVISSCPTLNNINSNTEYILANNFVFDRADCFNIEGDTVDNVIFNGNNTLFNVDSTMNYLFRFERTQTLHSHLTNITFKNFNLVGDDYTQTFYLDMQNGAGIREDFYFENINIKKFDKMFYFYCSSFSCGGTSGLVYHTRSGDFTMNNIFLETEYSPFIMHRTGYNNYGRVKFDNLNLTNFDWKYKYKSGISSGADGALFGTLAPSASYYSITDFNFLNVNVGGKKHTLQGYGINSLSTVDIATNVFIGGIAQGSDVSEPYGLTDNLITDAKLPSGIYKTLSECFSSYCDDTFISQAWQNPNVYESNTNYIQTLSLDLNATFFHNFENVVNSNLDLSSFSDSVAIDLTTLRTLRMGSNNKILGSDDTSLKPKIRTTGAGLNSPYTTFYANNYHLIEFDNNLQINNIDFELTAVGNYGLARKKSSASEGKLSIENSNIDLGRIITEPDMPMLMVGNFFNFQNNEFNAGQQNDITFIAGGISADYGGGHTIINNKFFGGGYIFQDLQDGVENFPSKLIHNNFNQDGAFYSTPFNPNGVFDANRASLMYAPQLNGSSFYKTECTNYEFNIGNYYEDAKDNLELTDSNADGINDDDLFRGFDLNEEQIYDSRALMSYPYDYVGNLGSAINTYDTCQAFSFNVIAPTETDLVSGADVESEWHYVGSNYKELSCFESLNDYEVLYTNVNSSESKGKTYDVDDGEYIYNLKCCDTLNCDNIVKEIEPISFCVGDCENLGEVIGEIITVYGCTDSEANNYNSEATNDDGSCTYDDNDTGGTSTGGLVGTELFTGTPSESSTGLIGMYQKMETPLNLGYIVGIIMIILAILFVIVSLFYMVL